jgi:hypothetical protein
MVIHGTEDHSECSCTENNFGSTAGGSKVLTRQIGIFIDLKTALDEKADFARPPANLGRLAEDFGCQSEGILYERL